MLVFNAEDLGGTLIHWIRSSPAEADHHLDSSRKRARERESRGGGGKLQSSEHETKEFGDSR